MKMLHALVGYLAVTTLPFHPFAFAFPLASIDYDSADGFVNLNSTLQNHIDGALLKHVLVSIEETCKTVTTQNHSDTSGLMNPVPASGDIIVEARQDVPIAGEAVMPPIFIISGILLAVAISLEWIAYDNPVRCSVEPLVQHFVLKFSARNVRRLLEILSSITIRSIQNLTGLFATLPTPSILMELRARTGVTLITNYQFRLVEQLGQCF